MKTMIVTLPEKEESFFLELLKRFHFKSREITENKIIMEISEKHKALVRNRIKNTKTEEVLDWDKVQNHFTGIPHSN